MDMKAEACRIQQHFYISLQFCSEFTFRQIFESPLCISTVYSVCKLNPIESIVEREYILLIVMSIRVPLLGTLLHHYIFISEFAVVLLYLYSF